MKVTEADFTFSIDKIKDAATTWQNFNGFSGETCGKCRKTANILAGDHGWFCVCGHFNNQTWGMCQAPHETPDLGPTAATIQEAYAQADREKRGWAKIEYRASLNSPSGLWTCPDCHSEFHWGGDPIHRRECPTKKPYSGLTFLVGPAAIKTARERAAFRHDENDKSGILPVSFAEIKAEIGIDQIPT